MAGNSQRKGAMRKGSSRKGPTVGSGGQKAKGLKGRGPTPKASQRDKHPAARRAKAASKRTESGKGSSRSPDRPVTDVSDPVVLSTSSVATQSSKRSLAAFPPTLSTSQSE